MQYWVFENYVIALGWLTHTVYDPKRKDAGITFNFVHSEPLVITGPQAVRCIADWCTMFPDKASAERQSSLAGKIALPNGPNVPITLPS
jgi:hypothetical protein